MKAGRGALTVAISFLAIIALGASRVSSQSSSPSARKLLGDILAQSAHGTSLTTALVPVSTNSMTITSSKAAGVSGASTKQTLERLGLDASTATVSSFRFDVSLLLTLRPTGRLSSKAAVELFNAPVVPILRRESRDGRRVTLFFESVLEDEPFVLTVDRTSGKVVGWGLSYGRRVEVRPSPLPEDAGNHLWIGLKDNADTGSAAPPDYADHGDVGGAGKAPASGPPPVPAESAIPASAGNPSLACAGEQGGRDSLLLYVGITRAARDAADEEGVGPEGLVEGQAAVLQVALCYAGANVWVPPPVIENLNFVEPVQEGEASLEEMTTRLVTSPTDPGSLAFRARRSAVGGDIGIVIVDREDKNLCGWARTVGAEAPDAVAVVNWKCIGNQWSYLHEIAHLLGAYHDVVENEDKAKPADARAFVSTLAVVPRETLEARRQNCFDRYCGRLPYFSNPWHLYNGMPLGVAGSRDNARTIRARIRDVAQFGKVIGGASVATGASGVGAGDVPEQESAWASDRAEFERRGEGLARALLEFEAVRKRGGAEIEGSHGIACVGRKVVDAVESTLSAWKMLGRSAVTNPQDKEVESKIANIHRALKRAAEAQMLHPNVPRPEGPHTVELEYWNLMLSYVSPIPVVLTPEEGELIASVHRRDCEP